MSAKSRRPPRPPAGPVPVMTLEAVEALVAGPEPSCCAHHRAEYQAIVGLIRSPQGQALCLLCGSAAMYRGIFIPFDTVKFGGRVGKRRLLFYGMCQTCQWLPDKEARVEARVLEDVRRGRAAWN